MGLGSLNKTPVPYKPTMSTRGAAHDTAPNRQRVRKWHADPMSREFNPCLSFTCRNRSLGLDRFGSSPRFVFVSSNVRGQAANRVFQPDRPHGGYPQVEYVTMPANAYASLASAASTSLLSSSHSMTWPKGCWTTRPAHHHKRPVGRSRTTQETSDLSPGQT